MLLRSLTAKRACCNRNSRSYATEAVVPVEQHYLLQYELYPEVKHKAMKPIIQQHMSHCRKFPELRYAANSFEAGESPYAHYIFKTTDISLVEEFIRVDPLKILSHPTVPLISDWSLQDYKVVLDTDKKDEDENEDED
mmetsp:Transcript_10305/g.11369  ORF Transcript_10305/g.11369 Transcript_10305/m.11369 type:complete len:138 (+) Transcript_10305:40-453(+)